MLSEVQAVWSQKRDRCALEKKPHQIKVKIEGEINASCNGKNKYNAVLKLHVPQVLDINIIDWDV